MTKTEQRKLARKARQYGYFRWSETDIGVRCPLCREDVHGYWDTYTRGVRTLTQELDRAMVDHLIDDCEHPDSGSLAVTHPMTIS